MRLPLATARAARGWLRATLRTHRRSFAMVLGLFSLGALAGLAGPQVLGYLVDSVAAGHADIELPAVLFVVLLIVQAVLRRAARVQAGILGEQVLADTRERFVGEAMKLPLSTVEATGTGDLLSRATTDADRIDHAVRNAVPQFTVAGLTVVLTVVAMVVTSPLLSLGLLVVVPLLYFPSRWYWARVPRQIERMLDAWADVQSGLHETADGARTAEALGLIERRVALGRRALGLAVDRERGLRRLTIRWVPWVQLSQVLPIGVLLLLGAWAYTRGLTGLGTIATMALYLQMLAGPLEELLWWTEDVQVSGTALRRVLGVRGADRAGRGQPRGREIVVRDVRYGYSAGREVLHGIDLRIPAGERLAIVGPSGAGKSTFGRLLAGVAAPDSGSVTVGGTEVSVLPEDVLRGEVLLLTQEHHVFAGSLRENLTLPAGEWRDADLLRALDAVGLREWCSALTDGLDTRLGAGALAVPAAVAQQLALARVVLADPHTVVLDEATSLLDTSSARQLERSLSGVLEGRTVIAIAHRLHTAAAADRVAVVEEGRITELGPHADLLRADGPYARLVEAASVSV